MNHTSSDSSNNQDPPRVPPIIPDHTLIRIIGQGSYGDVWLARNMMATFRAVKVVYRGRFRDRKPYERELAGIRKYEPVSRTYEGFIDILHIGRNDSEGYFFYVMELGDDLNPRKELDPEKYIPKTLERVIQHTGKLQVKACLEIGLTLSTALRHLHEKKLVHRDVKPSNIIFVNGIAKLADIGLVTGLQDTRSFVGTEGFTPPEGPGTQQADIYSLGKVLYEMSTGRDRSEFPILPDYLLEGKQHDKFVELNEVILKSCHPSVENRYQSAKDLHAELTVIDNGHSVVRLRSLEKYLHQFKRISTILALICIPLVLLGWNIFREYQRTIEEKQRRAGARVVQGNRAMEEGDYLGALPHYLVALQLDKGDESQEELHRLRIGGILSRIPKLVFFAQTTNRVRSVAIAPNGKSILAVDQRGGAYLWNMDRPEEQIFVENTSRSLSGLFLDNGTLVAIANGAEVSLFNSSNGKLLNGISHTNEIYNLAISPNKRLLATTGKENYAIVWDLETKSIVLTLRGHRKPVRWASFNQSGDLIVTTGEDGKVILHRTECGSKVFELPFEHKDWVYKAGFSPNGIHLASASFDREVKIWDIRTGTEMLPPLKHRDGVTDVCYSPDGRYIITACMDNSVRIWDADTHLPVLESPILPHSHRVMSCNIGPQGRQVISGCEDGSVRIWDLASGLANPMVIKGHLSKRGAYYISQTDSSWQLRNISSDALIWEEEKEEKLSKIKFNASDQFVVFGSKESSNALSILGTKGNSTRGKKRIENWPFPIGRTTLSFDGKYLAGWFGDRVEIRDIGNSTNEIRTIHFPHVVTNMLFSPVESVLTVVSSNKVHVIEASNGKNKFPPLENPGQAKYIAFNSNGKRLGVCCTDQSTSEMAALVWDLVTGKPIGMELNHRDGVLCLDFHPDGELIATGGEDDVSHIWNLKDATINQSIHHNDNVNQVTFLNGGRWILTRSSDYVVKVLETAEGQLLLPPLYHSGFLLNAQMIKDNSILVVQDYYGKIYKWEISPDTRPIDEILRHVNFITGEMLIGGNSDDDKIGIFKVETWRKLHSLDNSISKQDFERIAFWHLTQGYNARKKKQWYATKFHLMIYLEMFPDDVKASRRLKEAINKIKTNPKGQFGSVPRNRMLSVPSLLK